MGMRNQRGQTLVELLVGLAVTSVILGALAGTLYTVSDRYANWSGWVANAGNGFSLAAALQADGHRYVPCQATDPTRLDFVVPSPLSGTVAVMYASSASSDHQSFVVTRTVVGPRPGPAVVVDRLPRQPEFTVDSTTFTISVSGVAPGGPGTVVAGLEPTLVVYCHPPAGGCA